MIYLLQSELSRERGAAVRSKLQAALKIISTKNMTETRHRNKRTAQKRDTLRKHIKDNISTAFGRYKRAAESDFEQQEDRETEVWGVPAAFNPRGRGKRFRNILQPVTSQWVSVRVGDKGIGAMIVKRWQNNLRAPLPLQRFKAIFNFSISSSCICCSSGMYRNINSGFILGPFNFWWRTLEMRLLGDYPVKWHRQNEPVR